MNKDIKVSLIIPVFNTSLYLRQCLDSAVCQSLQELEIICVDDGSTDSSWDTLQEYECRYPNLRCIRFRKNRSVIQARKTGVLNASGEYIMFLDSDDYLEKNACKRAYNAINMAGTDVLQFQIEVENCSCNPSPDITRRQSSFMNKMPEGIIRGDLLSACFVNKNFVWSLLNKIYSSEKCKTAYQKIGDEYINFLDDLYAHFFLLETAESYSTIKDTLYHYCFGRGMTKSGRGFMTLNEFRNYCESEKYVCRTLERYVASAKLKPGTNYQDTLKAIINRRIRVHCSAWFTKLRKEDSLSGFYILYETWSMDPGQLVNALYSELRDRSAELTDFFALHAEEFPEIIEAMNSMSK